MIHDIFSRKISVVILLCLFMHSIHSMENPKKDSVLSRFWQENNRSEKRNTLPAEAVPLIEQTVLRAAKHKSLKGKALKDYLLKKEPLADSQALLLSAASLKLGFTLGYQYGAYALALAHKENDFYSSSNLFDTRYAKELDLDSELRRSFFREMARQWYLLAKSTYRSYFFSVRELYDHECIPFQDVDDYHKEDLYLNERLNSLDGLDHFPQLESFHARSGRIEDVTVSDTQKLTRLKELIITQHRLSNIPGIASLTTLQKLDLSANQLADANLSYLQGLGCLTELTLSSNDLTSLQAFTQLTQLQSLDVGNNQIMSLSEAELKPFNQLTSLSAYSNWDPEKKTRFSNVDGLYQLTRLKKLDLRRSGITELRPALQHLTDLKKVNLDENSLTTLGALVQLPNLKSLSVRFNEITVITPEEIDKLTKLTYLKRLYLDGNHLPRETQESFKQSLSHLKYLNFESI